MANPHRGEVEIVLAGETYVLKPTFEALVETENRTDKAILELFREAATTRIRTRDAAVIVWACARAAKRGLGFEVRDFGRLLVEEGFTPEVTKALCNLLTLAVGGSKKADTLLGDDPALDGEAAPAAGPSLPAEPTSAG